MVPHTLITNAIAPRTAKASNLGRDWNFTWDGQAGLGLGHPPREGGGGRGGGAGQGEMVCKRGGPRT